MKNIKNHIFEYLIEELSKEDNKKKMKAQVIDPLFIYILDKIYPYIIITSVIFILTFIIGILILFFIIRNKNTI